MREGEGLGDGETSVVGLAVHVGVVVNWLPLVFFLCFEQHHRGVPLPVT